MRVVFDFETRSAGPALGKVGAWEYAKNATTEVLCMAYKVGPAATCLWLPGDGFPAELRRAIDRHFTWWAHNAFFERSIWRHIMQTRHNWPSIPDSQWRCSAAAAAAMSLPRSLAGAGAALGLARQKDEGGHQLMLQMCKPRAARKAEDPAQRYWFDDEARKQRLYSYCIADVDSQAELVDELQALPDREVSVWHLDQKINARGLPVDTETVAAAGCVLADCKRRDDQRIARLTGGKVTAATQRESLLNWLRANVAAPVPDVTKATIAKLAALPLGDTVAQVLAIRQSQGLTSTAKYEPLATTSDGRLRDLLLYHGASTGRWSGRRFQPQNLPRDGVAADEIETLIEAIRTTNTELLALLYGDALSALSMAIRNCVTAEEGKRLIVVDFSAIEARVLAWLAGEEWKLAAFDAFDAGHGEDMYRLSAARIGSGVSRQIGKVAELALGYQGGVGAFQKMASNYGLSVTDAKADSIKNAWRAAHPETVDLWHQAQAAAIAATVTPGAHVAGPLTFYRAGRYLYCRLPSGRNLTWVDPEIRQETPPWDGPDIDVLTYMGTNCETRKWERKGTYGGDLVQSATQATARDLLVGAMFRAEKAGYPIVSHVHDELVCEVDEDFGSLAELERIVSTVPEWAAGCPIAAAGFEGKRYHK